MTIPAPVTSTTSPVATQQILVTGAAGFVGSHLVELLSRDANTRVTATDAVSQKRLSELEVLDGVTVEMADLRDPDAVASLVADTDVIVHLAAVRTQASSQRPRDAHDINVGAAYDLLTAARTSGTKRVIFGSSHTIYGAFSDPHRAPYREDEPWTCSGINMYAATKLACEAYLEAFAGDGGPNYLALRLGTIYGPRTSVGSNGSLMTDVLDAIKVGKTPYVPWSASAMHGLIHVDDITEAIRRAVHSEASGMAINVSGRPLSSQLIYGSLVKLAGGDPATIQFNPDRTRYQYVSQDRMAEVLDFEPTVRLEDGLRSVVDWYDTLES